MAKNWYPVVDILACQECGTCVDFCPHGVYDKSKAPTPFVTNPGACVDHCHGCGNKCPVGAISYVGDNTDWVAPALKGKPVEDSGCGCGCGCGSDTVEEEPKDNGCCCGSAEEEPKDSGCCCGG